MISAGSLAASFGIFCLGIYEYFHYAALIGLISTVTTIEQNNQITMQILSTQNLLYNVIPKAAFFFVFLSILSFPFNALGSKSILFRSAIVFGKVWKYLPVRKIPFFLLLATFGFFELYLLAIYGNSPFRIYQTRYFRQESVRAHFRWNYLFDDYCPFVSDI